MAGRAIEGRYNDPFFGNVAVQETSKTECRRLRALLGNLNRAFGITMRTKGARYRLKWEQEQCSDSRHDPEREGQPTATKAEVPDYLQSWLKLYNFPDPALEPELIISARIEKLASANRGIELPGLPNSDFIVQLFRDLSGPWRPIAERHLDIVIERTRFFVYYLFDYIIGDDKRTRDAIIAEYVDSSFESIIEALQAKLEEVLRSFTSGYGLPLELELWMDSLKRQVGYMATQIDNRLDQRDSITYKLSSHPILKHDDIRYYIYGTTNIIAGDFSSNIVINIMLMYYEVRFFL